ncbi:MAG: Condensation domain-containing protein [Candidatus Kentron sp. G]|nr:MAG: Condensation domain-containing protein [Candidatus Kentron sp. G]
MHTARKTSMTKKKLVTYPLCAGQQELWDMERRFPNRGLYNNNAAWRLPRDISPGALRRAADRVGARHPAWRSTFHEGEEGPFQAVHDGVLADFREISAAEGADLEAILEEQASRFVDLEHGLPVRWILISIRGQAPVLLLIAHHIVTDGWSAVTAITELGMFYQEETGGARADLPLPARNYAEFIQEQADWLQSPAGERERRFWREKLSGPLPMLDLPTDRPRPAEPSFRAECFPFAIPAALQRGMRGLAKDAGVRPLTPWLAAWFVFLRHFGGREDLLTTMPVAGRGQEYVGVLGFFVNIMPIRVRCSGADTFRAFLQHTAHALDPVLFRQNRPLPPLSRDMDESTFLSLSQTNFSWHDFNYFGRRDTPLVTAWGPMSDLWHVGGMAWELLRYWHEPEETDICLWIMNLPDNQYGILQYASDLFDRATMERWSGHFLRLVEGTIKAPDNKISQLPLPTETR